MNVSEKIINQILKSYKDIDVETLESKKFEFNEGRYSIDVKNGTPRTLIVTMNDKGSYDKESWSGQSCCQDCYFSDKTYGNNLLY
ncbi:hypothetical protein [Paenibacillus sp. PvP094]|uniref:hypothetical protein n=1 Tax=Paenibacillus sp. PvP094 TaxID=3156394 RepID=UPI003393093D